MEEEEERELAGGKGGGEAGSGSRDLCVERAAAREQRETAGPIIDGALLGEHGPEFSRHLQHISPLCQAARRSATQTPRLSEDK